MPKKSEAEKASDEVEKTPKPPEPEPMVPPVTPTVVAQKVREGSRFWLFVPVPVCIAYDDIQKLSRTGRVKVEEEIEKLIGAQINSPRKQKGKDAWALKIEYPADPAVIVSEQCKKAVGQIRAAIGDCA